MKATPERKALEARVAAMRAQGMLQREIADALGISRSYAAALCDPDADAKRDRRRANYQGVCASCGAITRSNGTSRPSEFCADCGRHSQKKWTREAVIAAIQRFASVHGRPPTSDEWINGDPVNGYPPRSAVYRSSTKNSSAPFQTWREAVETACPGTHAGSGRRTDKEVRTMSNERNGYVVLRETETGWEVVAESDEGTQVGALNAALNGHAPEGRWVAIPGRYWRPRELKPRTIYDWAEETVSA